MSLAGSVVSGLAGGSDGYAAYQRITNGGFASGANWTILAAAWLISGGAATSQAVGGIEQSCGLVNSGRTVSIVFDTLTTHTLKLFEIRLYRSGSLVQTVNRLLNAAGTQTVTPFACNADWDKIRFVTTDAETVTIDNVSVIA